MFCSYEDLVSLIAENPEANFYIAKNMFSEPKNYLLTFQPEVFKQIWIPHLKEKGFFECHQNIYDSFSKFLRKWELQVTSSTFILHESVIRMTVPLLVTYELDLSQTMDILNRIKTLKTQWKLDQSVCGAFIAYFQSKLQKNDSKLHLLLSQFLQLFNITESNVDYGFWAIQMLHRSVGGALYDLIEGIQQVQDVYQDLILLNKKRMAYLFDKLKKRPATFSVILTELTHPENNKSTESQLKNLLILLVLYEYWNRFKHEQSKLKQNSVVEVFCQAFHRLMFILYTGDIELAKIGILLLGESGIGRNKVFGEKIGSHLVALHKIYGVMHWDDLSRLVEQIWKESFLQIKINEIYLAYCPNFVAESQKIAKSSLDECQTKSLTFSSIMSQGSFKNSQKNSRKSNKLRPTQLLRKWITYIEIELKLFSLQKVYLLLEGLKHFVLREFAAFEVQLKEKLLKLLTTVIKKIDKKAEYRYHCSLLTFGIFWELSHLNIACQLKSFNYEQQIMGLGLFHLCSNGEDYINIDELIDFHEKFNNEETLETLLTLKMMKENINGQSNERLKIFQLDEESFQGKLYKLIKLDLAKDMKKLSIIAELLLLRSPNITNNLLVNYVNFHFSRKYSQSELNEVTKQLSGLMNEEIGRGRDLERIRLFLKMGTVFEELDNRRTGIVVDKHRANVSESYFHFLTDSENCQSYLLFSNIYEELHYLKESIFFLQLHCYVFVSDSGNPELKKRALRLYQQMNTEFSSNIKHISKHIGIQVPETVNLIQRQNNQFALLIQNCVNGIEINFKGKINGVQVLSGGQPSFLYWMKYYKGSLMMFIKKISQQGESDLIRQNFILMDLVTEVVNIKLIALTKQPLKEADVRGLISKIESLKNGESQLTVIRILVNHCKNLQNQKLLQECYLSKLLENSKNDQIQEYLNSKRSCVNFQRRYMIYYIRNYCQANNHKKALAFIKQYQKLKIDENASQVNLLNLECRFITTLSFNIEDYLNCLKQAITIIQKKGEKSQYFQYYFKIFRMLFQRYNFTRPAHNDKFMEVFYIFLEFGKIMSVSRKYMSEAIFYLLRFVLEQFDYSRKVSQMDKNYGSQIVEYFIGHSKEFVPFTNYLLKKMSKNQERNQVIRTILNQVLTSNSQQCIWTISFLKNFNRQSSKKKKSEGGNFEINQTSVIYSKIYEDLLKKNILNMSHLEYIEKLVDFSLLESREREIRANDFKKIVIPLNLPFVFKEEYYIDKIREVKNLGNGKSVPIQMGLTLKHQQNQSFCMLNIIIKSISPNQFRMESNAANFFSDIGLMDKDTTYRIFHLTKTLVVIQHVQNMGTINRLITENFPKFRQIQRAQYKRFNKYLESNNIKTNQALDVYESLVIQAKQNVALSHLIRQNSKNVSHWWQKYTNFVRTQAHWSFIGNVVGLGDRHLDNILMTQSCKLVHIDFQYALDIGLSLLYPEWMPFRLTQCLIQPLGILGVFGMYYSEMIKVAKEFQKREDCIWKALSNLVGVFETDLTKDIIKRSKLQHYKASCLEEGIARLIRQANDAELLRLMYKGWSPYL